jgi:hypothetical protein
MSSMLTFAVAAMVLAGSTHALPVEQLFGSQRVLLQHHSSHDEGCSPPEVRDSWPSEAWTASCCLNWPNDMNVN